MYNDFEKNNYYFKDWEEVRLIDGMLDLFNQPKKPTLKFYNIDMLYTFYLSIIKNVNFNDNEILSTLNVILRWASFDDNTNDMITNREIDFIKKYGWSTIYTNKRCWFYNELLRKNLI